MSSAMTEVMHDLLNKLRVIGKVREGQKLDTSNGLNVYTDTWANWIFRKWNRDNKDEGIRFLQDLYRSLQQSAETVITELKIAVDETKKAKAIYVLINTATELKTSIKGLDNLAKTYSNFPTTLASLEGILRDYVIVTYTALLDAIPEDRLTKSLRESITYGNVVVYNGKDSISPVLKYAEPPKRAPTPIKLEEDITHGTGASNGLSHGKDLDRE